MLMGEPLVKLAVEGRKTQTRRPVNMEDVTLTPKSYASGIDTPHTLWNKGRMKYQVGREYSLQYGRGKPTRLWNPETQQLVPYEDYYAVSRSAKPLKIRVLRLRFEDVREISLTDAIAEGFSNQAEFWKVWTGFYDKKASKELAAQSDNNVIRNILRYRPNNLYQVVAIDFKVVR